MEDKSSKTKDIKMYLSIIAVSFLLAVAINFSEESPEEVTVIERNEVGEKASSNDYLIDVDGLLTDYPVEVKVSPKKMTAEQREEFFERAYEEMLVQLLGENESLDEIRNDLNTEEKCGDFKVTYSFDNYSCIGSDGKLKDEIPVTGEIVAVSATITYAGEKAEYDFFINVFPKIKTREEQFAEDLGNMLVLLDEEGGESVELPETLGRYKLNWKKEGGINVFSIIGLGVLACVGVFFGKKNDEKNEQKNKDKLLLEEYPQMLGQLSLLLSAGMTVQAAWERIVKNYERKKEENNKYITSNKEKLVIPVYEEMAITYHQIKDGCGERIAYEQFGNRIGLLCYRKLATLLGQNLRKGTKGLSSLLEKEADEAFGKQESMQKIKGEELSTKLLAPMMFMLVLVVVIVIVPAIMNFNY